MSCTNCNNNCGCNSTPCVSVTCGCPIYISSDCVSDVKSEFNCLDISSNLSLTETLEQIDAQVCAIFNSITNYFTLVNTGNGTEIYSGVNNLGQKKIRKINKIGNLVTVTQNTDDISIGLDTTVLNTFIEANQKTTVAVQLDSLIGKNIYKNTTTVGDVSTLNFRSLILEKQGDGKSLIRDVQENTNDVKIRLKSLKSDSFTITATDTEISIEQPSTATIPALYVNNLYEPTYAEWLAENTVQNVTPILGFIYRGKGTLSAPFTNSTVYPLLGGSATVTPNTAIQNALNGDSAYSIPYSYMGASTDPLTPDKVGQKIIIQDNQGIYTFAGNFNYTGINVEIQANVNSTTTGYLIDMNDALSFDEDNSTATIDIKEGYRLQINGYGFNNSGNTAAGITYATARICYLKGKKGIIYSNTNNITKYIVNADITDTGNNNDGNLCFQVECDIVANNQGVYRVGGNARVDIYSSLFSGTEVNTVNLVLKAFYQTGGQVRLFSGSKLDIKGGSVTPRTSAIVFTPSLGFTPILISQNSIFGGNAENLFEKTTTDPVTLEVTNSISGYSLVVDNIFESPNLWEVKFTENVLASGNIDVTKADLTKTNTTSAVNTIGNNFIESLRTFTSKNNARLASIPKYGAYLVQRDVNAGSLIVGTEYKVKTAGTGTPLGTVGDYFLAANDGSAAIGGVATLVERCTMI